MNLISKRKVKFNEDWLYQKSNDGTEMQIWMKKKSETHHALFATYL